jgi:anaerobic selenocysteine-containing dehydrogenase
MSTLRKISRRTWLKGMAAFSAAAGLSLMLASTAAEAKASKAAVHYRDYPRGMRMCHICKFYIAAGAGRSGMGCMGGSMMGMRGTGACQIVEGRISPMGYCDLYVPA